MHENSKKFFIEIVDSEIVLTTLLLPYALPLIRYRTGDAARFVEEPCTCGNSERRIEILGRINGDFIRIAGCEVRLEELDRVMKSLLPYLEPTYKLEVGENIQGHTTMGTLTLFVTKRENISISDDSLKTQIAQRYC
jgi:phenylacetate-coenzyme A ligase PaaK-like adenylate-forming protein